MEVEKVEEQIGEEVDALKPSQKEKEEDIN